jgi:hypothetical protein
MPRPSMIGWVRPKWTSSPKLRSFYMATVSETGWPYVQHRGGQTGFVQVLDDQHIAFADYAGNRQLISVGNLAGNQRVALIAVDYARRVRLKLLGTMAVQTLSDDAALARGWWHLAFAPGRSARWWSPSKASTGTARSTSPCGWTPKTCSARWTSATPASPTSNHV